MIELIKNCINKVNYYYKYTVNDFVNTINYEPDLLAGLFRTNEDFSCFARYFLIDRKEHYDRYVDMYYKFIYDELSDGMNFIDRFLLRIAIKFYIQDSVDLLIYIVMYRDLMLSEPDSVIDEISIKPYAVKLKLKETLTGYLSDNILSYCDNHL